LTVRDILKTVTPLKKALAAKADELWKGGMDWYTRRRRAILALVSQLWLGNEF
jgi:hypothetical protein